MATKRKTSTRKTTSRTSAAKSSTTRKTTGSKPASAKAAGSKTATGTSARKAATDKAASAARAAVTKAVAEKAKPEVAKVPEKTAVQKPTDAAPPIPEPSSQPQSQPQGVTTPSVALTKRALVERVAARAGLRKAQARPVVEAMLAELGEALARKEILKLQPLGVMRVTRMKENDAANVLVCKLRRKKVEKGGGDDPPLAEAAE